MKSLKPDKVKPYHEISVKDRRAVKIIPAIINGPDNPSQLNIRCGICGDGKFILNLNFYFL